MPRVGGMEALREMARHCRTTRVLVLTMHDDPAYLRSALAAGASGYLLKRAVDSELIAAIRAVDRGGTFVDPRLADVLVQDVLTKRGTQLVRSGRSESSATASCRCSGSSHWGTPARRSPNGYTSV